MRLQEPPWDGMADELAKVAFQPGTDPVVRDYIMQHLGHLLEQFGSRKEIEEALWRAVGTSDETTPGTALIALCRGYERDQRDGDLVKVRQKAFELAIAGDGGGSEVRKFAAALAIEPATPVILKTVAERVSR
jgi:hypothetical protein